MSANELAEQVFPIGAAIVGAYARDVLPTTFLDAAGSVRTALVDTEILLAAQWWRANALPMLDQAGNPQGGLLILTPRLTQSLLQEGLQ